MWRILFWIMTERITSAAPQSNSYYLEINHFRETATGIVNLGQRFNQNQWENSISQAI